MTFLEEEVEFIYCKMQNQTFFLSWNDEQVKYNEHFLPQFFDQISPQFAIKPVSSELLELYLVLAHMTKNRARFLFVRALLLTCSAEKTMRIEGKL